MPSAYTQRKKRRLRTSTLPHWKEKKKRWSTSNQKQQSENARPITSQTRKTQTARETCSTALKKTTMLNRWILNRFSEYAGEERARTLWVVRTHRWTQVVLGQQQQKQKKKRSRRREKTRKREIDKKKTDHLQNVVHAVSLLDWVAYRGKRRMLKQKKKWRRAFLVCWTLNEKGREQYFTDNISCFFYPTYEVLLA